MIYREISSYRAMRLIADGKTKDLFFQSKNRKLLPFDDYQFTSSELSKLKFFEFEK